MCVFVHKHEGGKQGGIIFLIAWLIAAAEVTYDGDGGESPLMCGVKCARGWLAVHCENHTHLLADHYMRFSEAGSSVNWSRG